MAELSDAEVFGTPKKELSDADVFGAAPKELSDAEVFSQQPKPLGTVDRVINFGKQIGEQFAQRMPFPGLSAQARDTQAQRRADLELINQHQSVMNDGQPLSDLDYSPEVAKRAKLLREASTPKVPSMTEAPADPIRAPVEYSAGDMLRNPGSTFVPQAVSGLKDAPRAAKSMFAQGGLGIAQNILDVMNSAGIGDGQTASRIDQAAANERKANERIALTQPELTKNVSQGIAQLATSAPATAAAILTRGNPAVTGASLVPFGEQVYGADYSKNRHDGKSVLESMGRTSLDVANEVGTELLQNLISAKLVPAPGAGVTWQQALKAGAGAAGIDLTGEIASTELDREIARVLGDQMPNDEQQKKAISDTVKQVLVQMIGGGATTTAAAKATGAIDQMDPQRTIGKALQDIVENTQFSQPTPQQIAEASTSKAGGVEWRLPSGNQPQGVNHGQGQEEGRRQEVLTPGAVQSAPAPDMQNRMTEPENPTIGNPTVEQNQQPAGMPIEPMQQKGMPINPLQDAAALHQELRDAGHRVSSTGVLYGAPDSVKTTNDLVAFRNRLQQLADEGKEGKMWYEDSGKAVLKLAEGDKHKAEKIVGLLAIYSPQQKVSGNTTLALKAYADYVTTGKVTTVSNMGKAVADKAQEWMDGTMDEAKVTGIKRSNFYRNLMREIAPETMGADAQGTTVDMHMARAGGYYTSKISSGVGGDDSSGQYQFMDREIKRVAKEFGWEPQQAQAAIWAAIKERVERVMPQVRDIAVKNGWMAKQEKPNKYGKTSVTYKPTSYEGERAYEKMLLEEGMKGDAPAIGHYSFGDAIKERLAQISWEARPSVKSGILPGIHTAPLPDQLQYLKDIDAVFRDDQGHDVIAKRLGLAGSETFFAPSAWEGVTAWGAQTETAFATDRPTQGKVEGYAPAVKLMNLYSAIRGYALSQDGVVWHYPNFASTVKDANGVQIDFGRPLKVEEADSLYREIINVAGHDQWAPAMTRTGIRVLNFTDTPNKDFHKAILTAASKAHIEGQGEFKRFGSIGDYIGNDWTESKDGQDYRQRISSEGRPDLLEWADRLRGQVAAVNDRYAAEKGWGQPAAQEAKGLPLSALRQGESRSLFGPESLGIPRNDMPQVAIKLRPAMLEWMNSRGINYTREDVAADSLKPSQAEYMESKVKKAGSLVGDNTDASAVLVSSDGYVIDGHHRWLAKARAHQTINIIKFDKPIREMIKATAAFAKATEHLKAESKHNFTPPPIESFIPQDLLTRADDYVQRFYANRPDVVIHPMEREKAQAMLEPIIKMANEAKAEYDHKVVSIAERTPAIGQQLAPVKGMKRAVEKLVTEENFNVAGMKDMLRSTVVVASYAHAQEVATEIHKEFNVLRIKNRSGFEITGTNVSVAPRQDFGGYSDVLVNITMPNGVIGEIQINVPEMLAIKADHGHKLYEAAREAGKHTDHGQAIFDAMAELYDYAYEAATQSGGESLTQMPSAGNALAGANDLPSSENLNTLPSGNSTKSSPPNVGTNRQPAGNLDGTFISDTSTGIIPQNSLQHNATEQQQAGAEFIYGPLQVTDAKSNLPDRHFAPALDEREMARRSLEPLERKQRGVVDAALGDLFGTGRIHSSWAQGVNFYGLKPVGVGLANYNPADRAIGITTPALDAAARGEEAAARLVRGWLAHELHHGVDNYRNSGTEMFYISAESPRLDMLWDGDKWIARGDLMAEALTVWSERGAEDDVRLYLNYPMVQANAAAQDGDEQWAASFAKVEIFAQMGALYTTNPDLMQDALPKWFEFFKEWNDARADGRLDASRVSLRNLLQKPVSRASDQGRGRGYGLEARPVGQDQPRTLYAAGGPRVGENAPSGGLRGGSDVLPAKAQAPASKETLSLYRSLASGKVPLSDHLPTHVNYSTFNSPDELKRLYAGMSAKYESEIQKQRRGVISIKETYADARRLIEDESGLSAAKVNGMLRREPGTAAGAAEIMARMAILEAATGAVEKMADKIKKQGALQTNEQEWLDFAAAIDRANMAHQTFLGARAEIGRAMNAIKAYAGDYNSSDIDAILKTYNGKDGLAKVADAIVATGLAAGGRQGANGGRGGQGHSRAGSGRSMAIASLAKATAKPGLSDAFIELWKAGLLSGPTTHLANLIGNTVFTMMRIPEAAVAGTIGAITRGDATHLGDAVTLTMGMIVGANQGFRAAWEVLKDEDATLGPTPTEERQHAIAGETFGAHGKLGAMIDHMGKAIRMPYRFLGAEDAVYKLMNMYGSLYAEAAAVAMQEGKAGWPDGFSRRVAELAKSAERYMLDPTGQTGPMPYDPKARAIAEKAIKDGLTYTFQNKLGEIGQWIESGRNKFKVMHGILPFVRTPLNIFRQSVERTPLAFASKQWRDEIKAGGHDRDLALGRAILGSTIMAAVASAVSSGMMTGGGDPEKDARKRRQEAGIPDYAIKINGKWYEYRRIEPLGTLMGAAADYAEIKRNASKEEDSEHLPKQVMAAFTQSVTNKTYMKALADLANVFSDPERYGDSYIAGYMGSVVPAGMAQYAQRQDLEGGKPVVRETKVMGEGKTGMQHFKENTLNAIQSRIPKTQMTPEFNRQNLPARVDSWGETKTSGAPTFTGSPLRSSEDTADKVRSEAMRLGIKGTSFNADIMGVKLDGHQYEQAAREGGKLAHEIVASIVSQPGYDVMPKYMQKAIFDLAIKEGHTYGKGIITTPEIIDKHVEKVLKGLADVEQ